MTERERDKRGAVVWGNPAPVAPPLSPEQLRRRAAFRASFKEEFDRHVAYRKQLLDDLGVLEVRIMTAFHYFGTCGVPEDARSAALRASDPAKWWRYVDVFLGVIETWAEKLDEAERARILYFPDPPDLYRLVRGYLTVDDEDTGDLH